MQKEKGKHSEVYLTQKYAIKVFRREFLYNFWKEVKFLTLLQALEFVPKLYFIDVDGSKLVMERIHGVKIGEILRGRVRVSEDVFEKVVLKCLNVCFVLDVLGIQKEEMHRPDKHIMIDGERVVFIDFERSYFSEKTSNLTQFVVYLPFQLDGELVRLLAKYKKEKGLERRYKSYLAVRKKVLENMRYFMERSMVSSDSQRI